MRMIARGVVGARIAGVLVPLLLAACAGDGESTLGGPGEGPAAGFAQVQREVFDRRCNTASCHSSQTRAGGLSLASGEAYAALVGEPAENAAAQANGWNRVTASDPDASFLLRKLSGEVSGAEGSPMPVGSAGLLSESPEEYEAIRQWVLAGAPNN